MSGSYVTDDLRTREDDIIWRVKYRDSWIYIYLLIEFQSTIDKYMAVRLMTYMGLLYQDLIKTRQLTHDKRLPPIFPVVLYNGKQRWNAATELKDLIVSLPGGLEHYLPSLKYLILDEGSYGLEQLTPLKNLVAAIFRLENSSSREEIINVISNLIEWLSTPEQSRLRRSFSIWINRVLQPLDRQEQKTPEINDLIEIKTMLAERIPQWIQEGEARGKVIGETIGEAIGEARGKVIGETIGEARGEAKTLLKLLNLKFGMLPDRVEKQVNSADKTQLDSWVEHVLTTDSIDDMFS